MHAILQASARTLALASLTLLAACGGGGDDPGASPAPMAAPTGSTPAAGNALAGSALAGGTLAASTLAGAGNSGSSTVSPCSLAELDSAAIAALNTLRAQAQSCGSSGSQPAAGALRWSGRLYDAALAHAQDMVARNYFSHTSADGRTLSDRVEATGYGRAWLAENIARGQTDLAAVMASWMGSAGHCANIMGAVYEEAALACARDGSGRRTWVLVFGRPA